MYSLGQDTSRKLIPAIFLIGTLALLLYFFDVILLVFAGVLLAVVLRFFSALLEKVLPIGERTSLLITVSVLLTVSGAVLFFSFPEISRQMTIFVERLPDTLDGLRKMLERIGLGRFVEDLPGAVKNFTSRPGVLAGITGFFSTTFGFIADMGIILLIAVFLAADPDLYVRGTVRLFPPPAREDASALLIRLGNTLRWWLFGRLIAMVFIGILTTLGLWAIGIPLALLLGFLAGLLNFIPYIGPIFALLPAVLFALPQGVQVLGLVLVLYFSVQTVENAILSPVIQQKAVDLPPVYGIVFQVILGISAGGFGVIVASPLAAVSIVLLRELYLKPLERD